MTYDNTKTLASAAKGFSKAQRERGSVARRCFERAKAGDKGWGDLMHAGEGTLVAILASQAFKAGYALACKHLMDAGDITAAFQDLGMATRGTYTERELSEMEAPK